MLTTPTQLWRQLSHKQLVCTALLKRHARARARQRHSPENGGRKVGRVCRCMQRQHVKRHQLLVIAVEQQRIGQQRAAAIAAGAGDRALEHHVRGAYMSQECG